MLSIRILYNVFINGSILTHQLNFDKIFNVKYKYLMLDIFNTSDVEQNICLLI